MGKPTREMTRQEWNAAFCKAMGIENRFPDHPPSTVASFLGLCGCGKGEEIEDETVAVMQEFAEHWSEASLEQFGVDRDTWVGQAFLMRLDDLGMIEHGSNIRYSWPTRKGEAFARLMPVYLKNREAWDTEWRSEDDSRPPRRWTN